MFKVQPFSQVDPRWKDKRLGVGTGKFDTLGYQGCLLTSLTMVVNGFGQNETPASLNDRMLEIGGFVGSGLRVPAVSKLFPGIQQKDRFNSDTPPAPLAVIDDHLVAGLPVIVKVKYPLRDGTIQDHWVVLIDRQGEDYLVQDPFPIRNRLDPVPLSTTSYGKLGQPQEVIRSIILLSGPLKAQDSISAPAIAQGGAAATTTTPAPRSEPVPSRKSVPEGALTVFAAGDDLAIRKKPIINKSNVIKRVAIQSKFIVLDPPDKAHKKIGKGSTWLEVQSEDGTQGYVAAWLVALKPPALPQPASQADAAPQPVQDPNALVVYAAAGGRLALRRQPVISEATLVRWVPTNTQFFVLEPAAQARRKIGVKGQWLKVRDVQGNEGFVAAWFVSASPADQAVVVHLSGNQPATIPPAAGTSEPLVLRTAEAGLALRNQPVISARTLIKRLPVHTELLVTEPASEAEKKIGVINQWLKVCDIHGAEGYIAAWYVVKRPLPQVTTAIEA